PGRVRGRLAARGAGPGGRPGRLDLRWRAGVCRGASAGGPPGGHRDRPGGRRGHLRPADRPRMAGGADRSVVTRCRRAGLPDPDLPEAVKQVPHHGPTTLPERHRKIRALTGMGLVGLLCLLLVVGAATVGPWRVDPAWELTLPENENTPTPQPTATPTVDTPPMPEVPEAGTQPMWDLAWLGWLLAAAAAAALVLLALR